MAKKSKNKLDINKWFQRFTRATDLQGKSSEERKQAIKLYTGTTFGKPTDDTEDSEVNFVYEFLDVILSAIYARNPHIFVRSDKAGRLSFAQTMEEVINYYWREKKVKQKMKRAIRDAILQPPGWISVGFQLEGKERDKFTKDLEREFPELKKNPPKTEEQEGILNETVKRGDIFINYLSSWDVVWPDGYNEIRTAPYLFIIERTNLEDVQNNPIYKNSKFDLRKFVGQGNTIKKPTSFTMDALPQVLNNQESVDLETIAIKLIHVWDRRGQQVFTLAENFTDDTLFGPKDWNLLSDGFPFFPLVFNEIPQTDENSNSYPLSDVTPMIPQLKDLSKVSAMMVKHGKRMVPIVTTTEDGMSEPQRTNYQTSDIMELVIVDDPTKVVVNTPPTIPAAWFNLKGEILQDLFRTSGMKQLLASAVGVDTATESENIREGGRIRQSGKIDVIEDFTVDIARFVAGLLWQFIDRAQIAEIIGEEVSEEMWPDLPTLADGKTRDIVEARRVIQKEIHFRIDAGSTRPPKDEAIEQKLFSDAVGILKANFPGRFKEDVILEQLLKKMKIPEAEKAVIKFDDEEIAAAQKENELLMQGIPVPVSPNQNHQLHLQVHGQIEQNATTQPTPELDEHINITADFLERTNPTASPQRGDSKIAPQTTTPNARRQGVTEFADIKGSTAVRQPGANRGGRNA